MIRYLVMDVDGTLTDGKLYIGSEGELFKAFSCKDGCGIHDIMMPRGVVPVIITGRTSGIVAARCRELGITEIYQGVRDKAAKLREVTEDLAAVAYIGDDLPDLPCMEAVKNAGGLVGCPADAAGQVRETADFVAAAKGGDGAVREFIEWICGREGARGD